MSATQIDDGGPAFPFSFHMEGFDRVTADGMSLRDWFAGQALAGLTQNGQFACGQVAAAAYSFADAMISARKQQSSPTTS